MSIDRIASLVAHAKEAASSANADGADPSSQKAKLAGIAAEFESMLLSQMLKEMRKTSKWDDDEEEEDSLGAGPLFEMIDVELASRLSKTGAFGLGPELLKSFERQFPDVAETVRQSADVSKTAILTATTSYNSVIAPAAPAIAQEALEQVAAVNPALAKTVTSNFGWRQDPFNGTARFHKGVDLRAAYGEDVKAAAHGRVVFEGVQGGYGTTVVLEHDNGIRTRYAHLSAADVSQGQTVSAGQVIGRAGHSGRATGTHVHFEVTAGGRPIDPREWAPGVAGGLKVGEQVADLRLGYTGVPDSRGAQHED